jgi:hypothetical protein
MIKLTATVEDNDPEVERLLGYLNENCTQADPSTGNPIPLQIWLLKRTLSWLTPQVFPLCINPRSRAGSATASLSLTPSQTPPVSQAIPEIAATKAETPS